MVLAEDLGRMEETPHQLYNMHPGSAVGQSPEAAMAKIADALERVAAAAVQTTTLLLETMAGKGSEIGGTFEQLAAIIEQVELSDHVGVCLDTCHVWDAGYDIVGDLDGVHATSSTACIGLDRLRAIHLNDSQNARGSHKDRHARIGEGEIGFDALRRRHEPSEAARPAVLSGNAQPHAPRLRRGDRRAAPRAPLTEGPCRHAGRITSSWIRLLSRLHTPSVQFSICASAWMTVPR